MEELLEKLLEIFKNSDSLKEKENMDLAKNFVNEHTGPLSGEVYQKIVATEKNTTSLKDLGLETKIINSFSARGCYTVEDVLAKFQSGNFIFLLSLKMFGKKRTQVFIEKIRENRHIIVCSQLDKILQERGVYYR